MVITASRALGLMIPAVIIGAYYLDAPVGVIWGVAFANVLAGAATALFVLLRAPMTAKHGRQRKRRADPQADPVAAQDTP